MKHSKIAIIGAGAVGTTTAFALMMRNVVAEICLVDINAEKCDGEVRDLADALPFSSTSAMKQISLKDAGSADIIIVTAGQRQKQEQTRLELFNANRATICSIIEGMMPINPHAILLMVTNPVDVLTHIALTKSGLPSHQVFGSGTWLDTQRLRRFITKQTGVSEKEIHMYVIGEHGDNQLAAWSCADIGGSPLHTQTKKLNTQELEKQTTQEVYEIIKRKGATFFGVAACVTDVCEAILFDQHRIIPVSCFLKEFGTSLNMPAVIGEQGIERIINLPLNEHESQRLKEAAQKLLEVYALSCQGTALDQG